MSENRNVIVNADDLGARESVNHAIVHLLEQGLINRATMLANFPGFDQAVQLVHQKGLVNKIGIHLNLTEGVPLHPNPLKKDHLFSGVFKFRQKFKRSPFFIGSAERKYIYEELDAQISKVKASGIPIDHIDSHHHVHEFYCIAKIVIELAKKHNIKAVRILNQDYASFFNRMYKKMIIGYLAKNNLNFTDLFTNQFGFLELHQEKYSNGATESIEIMIHPDYSKDNVIIDKVAHFELGLGFLRDLKGHLK